MEDETLFDLDECNNPADTPLDNTQHERFAQFYAGESFGNATAAYLKAYSSENKEAAGANASRLLRAPEIQRRIKHLRAQMLLQLGVDQFSIAQLRKAIAEGSAPGLARSKISASERLAAARDLEKGLGLTPADKITLDGQLGLSTPGALHIADPAILATLTEAARNNNT